MILEIENLETISICRWCHFILRTPKRIKFKTTENTLKSIPSSSVKDQAENAKNSLTNAIAAREEAKRKNPDGTYPEPEEVEDNPLDAFSVMKIQNQMESMEI